MRSRDLHIQISVSLQLQCVKMVLLCCISLQICRLLCLAVLQYCTGNVLSVVIRDVNETRESRSFFSIPGNEFLDFRESRLATPNNRPIVSG